VGLLRVWWCWLPCCAPIWCVEACRSLLNEGGRRKTGLADRTQPTGIPEGIPAKARHSGARRQAKKPCGFLAGCIQAAKPVSRFLREAASLTDTGELIQAEGTMFVIAAKQTATTHEYSTIGQRALFRMRGDGMESGIEGGEIARCATRSGTGFCMLVTPQHPVAAPLRSKSTGAGNGVKPGSK
jgi:hypothetical protein